MVPGTALRIRKTERKNEVNNLRERRKDSKEKKLNLHSRRMTIPIHCGSGAFQKVILVPHGSLELHATLFVTKLSFRGIKRRQVQVISESRECSRWFKR